MRALPIRVSGVPAIAVTAYGHPADRATALAAGFDQHVAKPLTPRDLVAAVATLVRPGAANADGVRRLIGVRGPSPPRAPAKAGQMLAELPRGRAASAASSHRPFPLPLQTGSANPEKTTSRACGWSERASCTRWSPLNSSRRMSVMQRRDRPGRQLRARFGERRARHDRKPLAREPHREPVERRRVVVDEHDRRPVAGRLPRPSPSSVSRRPPLVLARRVNSSLAGFVALIVSLRHGRRALPAASGRSQHRFSAAWGARKRRQDEWCLSVGSGTARGAAGPRRDRSRLVLTPSMTAYGPYSP